MNWQAITTSNSEQAFYRDLLAQWVQVATSKHVATVSSIVSGGTGYVVGDVLSYTHASATHGATFEVTAVSSGVITQLRIVNGGAFGRRVASVAVGASGGSGYVVGDIVEIDESHVAGTDFRQRCKMIVDTVSSGAVTALSIFEGGGNYDGGTDPSASDATTTAIGGAGGGGSGLVVDTTMQAITGTTSLSLTGGTGSGAQVDVTLANSGHVTLRDDHDYTTPHGETDEKQVVLQGTVAGGDEPLVGYITFFEESGATDYWGVLQVVMDAYNDGLALENQVGANTSSDTISTTAGAYVPSFNEAETCWLSMDGRSIRGVNKTIGTSVNAYHQFGQGLLDPFGTATEAPYPMFQVGSVSGSRVWAETSTAPIDVTGFCEAFRNSNRTSSLFYRRVADGLYLGIENGRGTSFPVTVQTARNVFPIGEPAQGLTSDPDFIANNGNFGWHGSITQNDGSSPTILLMPAEGTDEHTLLPAVIELRVSKTAPIEFGPAGRFPNVYWCSGTKTDGTTLGAEDTLRDPNDPTIVYRVFPTGVRTETYSFVAMREGSF